MPLDGVDAPAKGGEHCGLIAGAGADLQHTHLLVEFERLGHVGDHIGLADGLAAGDGECCVLVGALPEHLFDENFARRLFDGAKHAIDGDALLAQRHEQRNGAFVRHESFLANC